MNKNNYRVLNIIVVIVGITVIMVFGAYLTFYYENPMEKHYETSKLRSITEDNQFIKEFQSTDSCEIKEYMLMKKPMNHWWYVENRTMIYDEYELSCLEDLNLYHNNKTDN